jgi:anti-anti-sigma regulatory factor
MGSPGVGALVTIRETMNKASEQYEKPAKLALFGINSSVHNLLSILKIDTFFQIFDNESDAMKYLSE